MPRQLDLFEWAENRPPNVIDLVPALIRKAAMEVAYSIPRPKADARIITIPNRRVA